MDNLEMELLRKEVEILKKEHEQLSQQISKESDNLGAMLVLIIVMLIIIGIGVGYVAYRFLQISNGYL